MTMSSKSLSLTFTGQVKLQPTSAMTTGSALSICSRQFSEVKLEDNSVLTAKQIQELQKRNKCHLHTKLQVRTQATHRLRFEHTIVIFCRVLCVNR